MKSRLKETAVIATVEPTRPVRPGVLFLGVTRARAGREVMTGGSGFLFLLPLGRLFAFVAIQKAEPSLSATIWIRKTQKGSRGQGRQDC